jgi:hypothetical protein
LSLAGTSLTPAHFSTVAFWLLAAAVLSDRRVVAAWRRRSTLAFYVLAAVVLATFALGPVGRVGGEPFLHAAPYSWLMSFPGGDSLRVPARFGMLVILCLACGGALAFARIRRQPASVAIVLLLILVVPIDGWVPRMKMARAPELVTLSTLDEGAAVLEVPMRNLYSDTAAMIRATAHGRPLVNGFSGYGPRHYRPLSTGLAFGDAGVLQALTRYGPLAVLVNRADDPYGTHEAFVAGAPGGRLVARTRVGPVFLFPRPEATTMQSRNGRRLGFRVVRVTANDDAAAAIADGQVDTAWTTARPQRPGDALEVALDGDQEVARVELDLGTATMDFPRRLLIEARNGAGEVRTAWSGGTAGQTVLALLARHPGVPIVIDLPAGTRAQALTFTLSAEDRESSWTVAELRLFGPSPDAGMAPQALPQ